VLRPLAAAAACASLTVDAAAEAAYCTSEAQQMVFCTTIAQIQGVSPKVFF